MAVHRVKGEEGNENQKASKIDGHYSIRAGVNNQWSGTEKDKKVSSSVTQRKKRAKKEERQGTPVLAVAAFVRR